VARHIRSGDLEALIQRVQTVGLMHEDADTAAVWQARVRRHLKFRRKQHRTLSGRNDKVADQRGIVLQQDGDADAFEVNGLAQRELERDVEEVLRVVGGQILHKRHQRERALLQLDVPHVCGGGQRKLPHIVSMQ
jgi:hypothetical protein